MGFSVGEKQMCCSCGWILACRERLGDIFSWIFVNSKSCKKIQLNISLVVCLSPCGRTADNKGLIPEPLFCKTTVGRIAEQRVGVKAVAVVTGTVKLCTNVQRRNKVCGSHISRYCFLHHVMCRYLILFQIHLQ